MNQIAVLALFGWIPVSLLLFTVLPSRRAVIVSVVGAWLFLPVGGINLPGFPDLTKTSATATGTFLGALLFDMPRVLSFRPRWADLAMVVFCLSAGASSLSNGFGPYDALSQTLSEVFYLGLPYLIGRLYFSDEEGLRELAAGIVVGGLVYVPFCLWEVRMAPLLHQKLYGFSVRPFFATAVRMGGYRPSVFMTTGLEVGLWMGATLLLAYAMWSGRSRARIANLPLNSVALLVLAVAFLLCRSTGAMLLTAAAIGTLWLCRRTGRTLPAILLILIPPAYIVTRTSGLWMGDNAVALSASLFGPDRAQSLEFRFENEDLLIQRALESPWLGWCGYGRNLVALQHGKMTITDGYWIIILGTRGLVGLISWTLVMLLPSALILRRYPVSTWGQSISLEIPAIGLLLTCYTIDCLLNAMINPVYILAAGGLMGLCMAPRRRAADSEPGWKSPAREYELAARQALAEGRADEAARAFEWAIEIRSGEAAAAPHDAQAVALWASSLNNLAWLLAEGPDPASRDAARAVALAEDATALDPGRPALWNTLGAARYRSGHWEGAIGALEQGISLGDDGSSLASAALLAMAHHQLGEAGHAVRWLAEARSYLAAGGDAQPAARKLFDEAAALIVPTRGH